MNKKSAKTIDYNSYNEQRVRILDDLNSYTNKQLIQMIAYQVGCNECPARTTCGRSGVPTNPVNCITELTKHYKFVGR